MGTSVQRPLLLGPPIGPLGAAIAAMRRQGAVGDDGGDTAADADNPLAALVAVGHSLFGLEGET